MTLLDLLHEAFPRANTPAEQLEVMAGLGLMVVLAIAAYLVVRRTGHPLQRLGRIVYNDGGRAPNLLSRDGTVTGRPDFVVHAGLWFRKENRPGEIKTTKAPRTPYAGHVLQLAAYGLLVEAETGHFPRVGYIAYHDGRRYDIRKVRLGRRAKALLHPIVEALLDGAAYPDRLPVDGRCGKCRHRASCPILAAQ